MMIVELAGVTVIDVSVALDTVSVVDPETPESVAEIVVVPAAIPVDQPGFEPVLLMDAVPVDDEPHVTTVVMSAVLESL